MSRKESGQKPTKPKTSNWKEKAHTSGSMKPKKVDEAGRNGTKPIYSSAVKESKKVSFAAESLKKERTSQMLERTKEMKRIVAKVRSMNQYKSVKIIELHCKKQWFHLQNRYLKKLGVKTVQCVPPPSNFFRKVPTASRTFSVYCKTVHAGQR